MKTGKIVDFKKLVIYPIVLFLTLMILTGVVIYFLMSKSYEKELLTNGSSLANSFAEQISMNRQMRDDLIREIDRTNMSTAMLIKAQRDMLSNDYLAQQKDIMGVDDIWWYSPSGVVLYDARDQYIGWIATEGDPIYEFMHSGLDIYIEDIRVSTEDEQQHKNVYIKDEDGSFVQVSTSLITIKDKLNKFINQNLIEMLNFNHDELLYIKTLDTNLVVEADTDNQYVGLNVYNTDLYQTALAGQPNGSYIYYVNGEQDVFEVAVPIWFHQSVIGVVSLGFSLEGMNTSKMLVVILISISVLVLSSLFGAFQLYWIRRPLNHLSKSLTDFDYEIGIPDAKANIFKGLFATVNKFIQTINEINQLNDMNYKKTQYISNHDFLTNLLNRRGIVNALDQWVDQKIPFVLLYLDLDNFKHYNDLKGHSFGDQLLIQIAGLLEGLNLPEAKIGRFGGDEFVIACKNGLIENIDKVVKNIVNLFNTDILIDGFQCYLTTSIGISFFPNDGEELEGIIENAEKSMVEAKKTQATEVVYFDEKFKQNIKYHTEITEMLIGCIVNDGFEMVYQPQVNMINNKVVAFEALLRVKGSNLSPGIFVPIAEKSGLMIKIGRIVIKKVIEQVSIWQKNDFNMVPIYINFSSTQLHDQTITSYIEELLNEYEVPAKMIGIEIIENVFLEKGSLVIQTLKAMKRLGLKTAIDDFGSGQAGVNYLTNFDVDIVKIGKDVTDKYLNVKTISIYKTIVQLCDTLGFDVLAEGIETIEQVQLLQKMGVMTVQGYYYYKPLYVSDIDSRLNVFFETNEVV